jgi:hypothetical protein
MKTITTKIMSAVALFGIMLTAESCEKERDPQGYMTVSMTDAPADYKAVNVEIIGLMVNTQNRGWINIPVKAGIYNLLDLQNNVSVVLANNARLPIGKATGLRLKLGTRNSIVVDELEFNLIVPSGEESGLKVSINETIRDNAHSEIMLDFDAKASIVEAGKGKFILKPVIKLKTDNTLINN